MLKIRKRGNEKMKNIEEKILMADEEIRQLQNKRKKLISQQKQEERKKRDKRENLENQEEETEIEE